MEKRKKLLWSVGKYVYQKGLKEKPLLHMPLQSFLRHSTEELCYLAILRGQIGNKYSEKIKGLDLFFWLKRNSIEQISKILKEMITNDKSLNNLIDVFSGVGFIYERMKLYKSLGIINKMFSYHAFDSYEMENKFRSLHQISEIKYKFLKKKDLFSECEKCNSIKLINFNNLIKRSECELIELKEISKVLNNNSIVVLRVNLSQADEYMTNVDQKVCLIPSIFSILELFKDKKCKFKYIKDFDADYFLPNKRPLKIGLLLIYNSRKNLDIQGYKVFDRSNLRNINL
tara:strand:+ start:1687 stop:2544 length:858 start_codon:yes stop_codon:yes gene_type:complete